MGPNSNAITCGDGFPAPDRLAAAGTKTLPPPNVKIGRRPIRSCVPTFHRLHRDPVADFEWTAFQFPAKRRLGSGHNLGVTRDVQVEVLQVFLKTRNIFQTPDAADCSNTHDALRRCGKPKTANPPSNARVTSTKQLKE